MTLSRLNRRLSQEHGAVLMIVAVGLFAMVMIVAFVLETANWYEHRRHLQLQADAAALAGGAAFQLPGCSNSAIYAAVRQYGGVKDATYPNAYNSQVGTTGTAHILVNSDKYWPDGGTDYSDGGQPCATSFVDVKMTETGLPWFLSNALVPAINAHARVSVMLANTLSGQLPIGVPDVNPNSAAVIFYDEANPTSSLCNSCAKYLHKVGTANGLNEWADTDVTAGDAQHCGSGCTAAPVPMPGSGKLGVALAFSSDGPPNSSLFPITDASGNALPVTTICGSARVDCYQNPTSGGLLFVHGEHATAANKIPVIQDATLTTPAPSGGTTCADSYAYFTYNTVACTANLRVNLSTTATLTNVQLTAVPGGTCGGGGVMSGTGNIRNVDITITANTPTTNAGPCPITITWAVKQENPFPGAGGIACGNNFGGNNNCLSANYGGAIYVQRAFLAGDDASGPIRTARVINMGSSWTNAFGATCPGPLGYGPACNSYPTSVTKSLAVDVQVAGAITTNVSDPPVFLRIVGGSQNGSLDCDATGNLRNQIATGCQPPYTMNTDPNLACPWATKTALFNSLAPYPCVAIQTGGSVGQFTQGIQDRILGGSNQCPASGQPGYNYWPQFPNFPTKDNAYGFDDPRIIYVFMVPFGSFRGSGNTVLPIVSFGVFYVRGWGGNGGGNDDPCPGAIAAPAGDLVGNFITHVSTSATSSGTQPCVAGSFNPCVAVLNK